MPKAQATKTEINKWDCIKLKSFCTTKEALNKMKRKWINKTYRMGENTAKHIPNKGIISKLYNALIQLIQFSSVTQSSPVTQLCLSLCDPMNLSTPGLPVHHQLPEFTQTHVHWVADAIQPSHPLSSPSPPAFNLSQHQGLFKWVSSLHQVAKVLEFQLQHQSFQWTFRTDLL